MGVLGISIMARTVRPDGLAPPTASVDALDDLNLDDMFEDGDDTLFDGLDIDLDGMGELTASPNGKKSTEFISQDLDAMKLDLLGVGLGSSVSNASPVRRKTKRTIKAPPALDDDGDEEYEVPKKKRKPAKATAKKTKGSTDTTKNLQVLAAMPPPFQRSTTDATKSVVAAAGQLGGRNQKKQPLSKQILKTKARSSPTSFALSQPSSAVAVGDPRRHTAGSLVEPPLPQPTNPFCGLKPSNTEFFPFMETLPSEPALKKTHRHFPIVYDIHACMTTASPHNISSPVSLPETDPLFRLMMADLDHQQNDRNISLLAHNQRRASLRHSILAARTAVSKVDKNMLLNDLRSVCLLLKRQHDFLCQSLENMEQWCRDHFLPYDFQFVYGDPTASGSKKRGSQATTVTLTVGSVLASLKTPFVKVKVRCSGFKAPKITGPLIAHVRLPGAGPPSTKSDTSKAKLKRKVSSMDADRTSVSAASAQEVVVDEVLYSDMKPSQRRQVVTEAVAQRAQSLELQVTEIHEKHRKAVERQRAELQKVIDDDDHLTLNTVTMWKWLEKSAYFADYLASDAREILESIWEPEINEARMSTRTLSAPPLEKTMPISEINDVRPVDSVFLKLQSLLVDERSGDEADDGEDDSIWDSWKIGKERDAQVDQSNVLDSRTAMIDLTGLTLDERACIHLRAAGLLADIRLDAAQPSLVEEDAFCSLNGVPHTRELSKGDLTNETATKQGNEPVEDNLENDIDTVIQSMQTDLVDLRRLNNFRIAFLESAVKSHLSFAKEAKRREEENATIIAKYNQLLKRQKEAKRSARHKPVKKDGDWVPW